MSDLITYPIENFAYNEKTVSKIPYRTRVQGMPTDMNVLVVVSQFVLTRDSDYPTRS